MPISTLIVDDQEDIRLLLRVVINAAHGVELTGEARNGEEALERVAELDPQVVVLDQMMPGMTGLDVARELRQRGDRRLCLLCSAHLDERVVSEAFAVGVDRCVSKLDVADIPGIIREMCAAASEAAS